MSNKTKIFVIGATGWTHHSLCFLVTHPFPGYIGGSVLVRLLDHCNAQSHHITALVRSPEKALKLNSFGVETVVGSLEDSELIVKLASESDVVFACVSINCWFHHPLTRKNLGGFRQRRSGSSGSRRAEKTQREYRDSSNFDSHRKSYTL